MCVGLTKTPTNGYIVGKNLNDGNADIVGLREYI
jgi:hypothetical protein